MLSLNSLSAWIEVDGKKLEEYGVEEDPDHKQVTCWTATQVDKNFSVAFRDDAVNRVDALKSRLHFDGSRVTGKILLPSVSTGILPAARTVVQGDERLSPTSCRSFMFSRLELTEEDEYLDQASMRLGEIQLRIYRVQRHGLRPFRPVAHAPDHTKVHERSKKAITHCVSFGKEMKTRTCLSFCGTKYLDGRIPLATFIFKYRDFGLLQANGIIPKPLPVRSAAEESFGLTTCLNVKPETVDEEIEIADNAPRSQKRTVVSVTRFGSSRRGGTGPAKRVKQEKEFVPIGEVIDLT